MKIIFFAFFILFSAGAQAQDFDDIEAFPESCKILPTIGETEKTGDIKNCKEVLIKHYVNPNSLSFVIDGSDYEQYDLIASCEEFGCCTAEEVEKINSANEAYKEDMLVYINSTTDKLSSIASEDKYDDIQKKFLSHRNKALGDLTRKIKKITLNDKSLSQCKKQLLNVYTDDSNGSLKSKSLRKDCAKSLIAKRGNNEKIECEPNENDFEVMVMCSGIFKKEMEENLLFDKEVSFPNIEDCCNQEIIDAQAKALENFRNIIEMGIDTMIDDAKKGEQRIAEFYEMRNNALQLLQLENEQIEAYDNYNACFEHKKAQNNTRIQINEVIAENADLIAGDGTKCYSPQRTLYNAQPVRTCPRYVDGNLTKSLMPECHAFMFDKINKLDEINREKKFKAEVNEQNEDDNLAESELKISDMEDNKELEEKCKIRIAWLYENSAKLLEDGQTFGVCENDNDSVCMECPAKCETIANRLQRLNDVIAASEEQPSAEQTEEIGQQTTALAECESECKRTCATAKCCKNFSAKTTAIKEKYAEYMKNDIDSFNQDIENESSLYEAIYNLDLRAALSFEKNNNNIIKYEKSVENCVNENTAQ